MRPPGALTGGPSNTRTLLSGRCLLSSRRNPVNIETKLNHRKLHLCPWKCAALSPRNLAPTASFKSGSLARTEGLPGLQSACTGFWIAPHTTTGRSCLSPLRSEAVHVVWSDRADHGAQLPPAPSPATVPNQPRMASPYLNLTKWHKFGPGPTFQLEPILLFLPTPITATEFALGNEENCPISY